MYVGDTQQATQLAKNVQHFDAVDLLGVACDTARKRRLLSSFVYVLVSIFRVDE